MNFHRAMSSKEMYKVTSVNAIVHVYWLERWRNPSEFQGFELV